jgi:hypothetical protein
MAFNIILGPILGLVNTVVDKIFPDATKAEEIKAQVALAAMKGEFDIQLASINAVNQTMQTEANSTHWAQWMWRPMIGFSFAAVIINNFILMPYLAKWLTPIQIPSEVWTAMLVVLGASAAGRSWEKVATTNAKNGK